MMIYKVRDRPWGNHKGYYSTSGLPASQTQKDEGQNNAEDLVSGERQMTLGRLYRVGARG